MGVHLFLENTGFAYEGRDVLHDLNLDLQVTRLGIVGRNGSGKSTLVRLLAGLDAPTCGTIRVNGEDLAKNRKAALREVGILFQNPDHQIIFPTVIEEMRFGLTQIGHKKDEADAIARDVLARFGKTHWVEAYVNTLSQGQKHLLGLMAISAMQPNMLILDEPFAGLDLPTKMQLNRYLELYEGALIHISHDPRDIEGYENMIWLEEGRIADRGVASEVIQAYLTEMQKRGASDDLSHLSG